MATTEKTPLWLELKKEYIDDNFNKLQAMIMTRTNCLAPIQLKSISPIKITLLFCHSSSWIVKTFVSTIC